MVAFICLFHLKAAVRHVQLSYACSRCPDLEIHSVCITQNGFCLYFNELFTMAEDSVSTWYCEVSIPCVNIDRLLFHVNGLSLEFQ